MLIMILLLIGVGELTQFFMYLNIYPLTSVVALMLLSLTVLIITVKACDGDDYDTLGFLFLCKMFLGVVLMGSIVMANHDRTYSCNITDPTSYTLTIPK